MGGTVGSDNGPLKYYVVVSGGGARPKLAGIG